MNIDRDMARITGWLEESRAALPSPDPGRILPLVLDRLPATRQRGGARPWLPVVGDDRAWRRWVTIVSLVGLGATMIGLLVVGGTPSPIPALSPGLVYQLDGDIFVADADGTGPVRVLDTDPGGPCGGFWGLAVSPDRRHIALRSNGAPGCVQTITIIDPDGKVLSTFPGEGWDVSWSPDSSRVATWLPSSEDGTVGIYGLDGALHAVLHGSNACCGDHDPVWSPDGAESVLIHHRDSLNSPVEFELPVDGTTPRPVPADDPRSRLYSPDSKQLVRYSPDGTRAAYMDQDRLVSVAADGTDRRELVARATGEVVGWSPDGSRIAYVDGSGATLRVVDVATGTVTNIATGTDIAAIGFSPDGGRLLYGSSGTDGDALWAANVDGSGTRILVEGAAMGGWLGGSSHSPSLPPSP